MSSTRNDRRVLARAGALGACVLLLWQVGAAAQEAPPGGPSTGATTTTTMAGSSGATAPAPVVEEDPSKPSLDTRLGGLATGARIFFSRPNTLPFDPLLPVSLAAASSIIDDGTSETRGFASAVYPGDILAGVGGLIGVVGFPIGGQLLPPDHPISQFYKSLPGFLPPWPFAVRGSFPGDPGRRVDVLSDVTHSVVPLPVPIVLQGAVQEANVTEGFVTASSYLGRVQLANPADAFGLSPVLDQAATFLKPFVGDVDVVGGDLVQLDGLRSRVEASDTGAKATSDAETTVSSIRLLGGLVELAGVRSAVSEASEGHRTAVTRHGVTVDAVRLLGVTVRLTDKGVEIADSRIPTGALGTAQELLNRSFTSLQQAGLSIKLPNATTTGPTRSTQTLEVTFYGQNPTIPFVIGPSTTTVTLAIGEAASRLEAEAVPPVPGADVPPASSDATGGLSDGALGAEALGDGTLSAAAPEGLGLPAPTGGAGAAPAPAAGGGAANKTETAAPPRAAARIDPMRAISDELGALVRRMAALTGLGIVLAGMLWRRRFGFR